jgi:hypothetical protein
VHHIQGASGRKDKGDWQPSLLALGFSSLIVSWRAMAVPRHSSLTWLLNFVPCCPPQLADLVDVHLHAKTGRLWICATAYTENGYGYGYGRECVAVLRIIDARTLYL